MVKSPPASMLKILKLPLLASMVSDEAPRPVMVTVPAVPSVKEVLALIMFGNAESKVMMKRLLPGRLKVMYSSPGVLLASIIASLKEIKLSEGLTVSAVVVT
jgi:hypothetical protein